MTKLKQPRKASPSSSAVRKKDPPRKGAIPAKAKAPAKAAKAGGKGKAAPAKGASKAAPAKGASKAAPAKAASKAAPAKAASKAAPGKGASKAAPKIAAAKPAMAGKGAVAAKPAAPEKSGAGKPAPKSAAPKIAAAKPAAAKPAARDAAAAKPASKATPQLSLPLPVADEDTAAEPAEPLSESPRKIALKAALHDALEQALAAARVAHHAAVEGATHEEARPESDKDTRGLEQSYLARGHAQRVADLEAGLTALAEMSVLALGEGAPIALGAIVKIDEADHLRSFLLAPAGGGMVLSGDITVLTPTSPIGRALLGRGVDDECEIGAGAHARTLTIVAVE